MFKKNVDELTKESVIATKSKWLTLVATCLGVLLLNIDLFIINVALPAISNNLHAPLNIVSWTISTYVLMIGVLPIGFGRLGDIWGQKRLYLGGVILFTIASLACGLATNIMWLIIFRTIQGVGAAAIAPGTLALLVRVFPKEQRGLAIGLNGGIGGLGLIAGPVLGGLLVHGDNWRWIFFINVPLGIITILLIVLFVMESRDEKASKSVDWLGLVLLSGGLFGVLFAFTRADSNGFDLGSFYCLLIGFLTLFMLIVVEGRRASPLIDLSLFKNTNFTMPCISLFLFSIALFGSQPYWSLFMQNFWEFTPLQGGLAFLPATVLIALLQPAVGILCQRNMKKLRYIVMCGVIIVGLSFLYVTQMDSQSNFVNGLLPALLLRGVGIPILMTSTSLLIMNSVPPDKAGFASGMLNMARNIGTAMGVALLGQFFSYDVSQGLLQLGNNIPQAKIADALAMAGQFMVFNDEAIKPFISTVILAGFKGMAMICAVSFIPALLSAILIKKHKSS